MDVLSSFCVKQIDKLIVLCVLCYVKHRESHDIHFGSTRADQEMGWALLDAQLPLWAELLCI
jgi:hypothetical protein